MITPKRFGSDEVFGCFVTILVVFTVFFVCYVVYDYSTGESHVEYAVVTDKNHVQETSSTPVYDDKGNYLCTDTDETNYYWVHFRRKNGKEGKSDVGSWKFNQFVVGQSISVVITIGGHSKGEYLGVIEPYKGAEVP